MKLIPLVLVLALLAAACAGSTQDLPAAVAGSSAQQAQAQLPEQEEQPPFCQAIDEISPYPFSNLWLEDGDLASRIVIEADPAAIAEASNSYRSVAALIPADAPNIIHYYFDVTPDVVAGFVQRDSGNDIRFASNAIVAGSVRGEQVEGYVTSKCPDATLASHPFTPAFVLSPDPLVTPDETDFCVALADFEQAYVEATSFGGSDDVPDAVRETAHAAAQEVTSLLDSDADRITTAYLRMTAYMLGLTDTEEALEIAVLLGFFFPDPVVDAGLQAVCSEETNPGAWLTEAQAVSASLPTVTDTVSVGTPTDSVADSVTVSGGGTESVFSDLSAAGGTFTVDSVAITVSAAAFERTHVDGTARDSDEILLQLDLSFDKGHDFAPVDFVVTAPDGAEFTADPEQAIPLDGGQIAFPVDRDIESIAGWSLQVRDVGFDL